MTQDEIIQMLHNVVAENQNFTTWTVSTPHLVALVNHAIAKEREACAKLCETGIDTEHPIIKGHIMKDFGASPHLANAIRARAGEQT